MESVVTEVCKPLSRNSMTDVPCDFRCIRKGCLHRHKYTDYNTSKNKYCCNACKSADATNPTGTHTKNCTGFGEPILGQVHLHSTDGPRSRSIRSPGAQQTDPSPWTSADEGWSTSADQGWWTSADKGWWTSADKGWWTSADQGWLTPSHAHRNACGGDIGVLSLRGDSPWIPRHFDQKPGEQSAMKLNMKSLSLVHEGESFHPNETCTPLRYIEVLTASFNMELSNRAHYEWHRTSQIIQSNLRTAHSFNVLIRILSYDHGDYHYVHGQEPLDCRYLDARSDRFGLKNVTGVDPIVQAYLATNERTPLLIQEAVFRLQTDQYYNQANRVVVDFACNHGTHRSVACAVLLAVLAYPRAKIWPCSRRVQHDFGDDSTLTWGL